MMMMFLNPAQSSIEDFATTHCRCRRDCDRASTPRAARLRDTSRTRDTPSVRETTTRLGRTRDFDRRVSTESADDIRRSDARVRTRGVEKYHMAMRRHTLYPIFARVEHETRPTRRRVAAFASPPHPRARAERRHRVVVSRIIAFIVARRPDEFGATSGGTDVRRREPPTLAVASLVVEQRETHELVDVVVAARAESPRVRA
jgi:hypothetical protein